MEGEDAPWERHLTWSTQVEHREKKNAVDCQGRQWEVNDRINAYNTEN